MVSSKHSILITAEAVDDHVNILVGGQVNSDTAADLEAVLRSQLEQRHRSIVLSFENVSLITSAGLRVLLVIAKELDKVGGSLACYAIPSNIADIFRMTGFDAILALVDTYEQARDSVSVAANRPGPARGDSRRDSLRGNDAS